MLSRLIAVVILLPVAVILIALTVANRETVGFTLDPFDPGSQALTFHAPLFVFLYLALLLGLVIGGAATWFTQHKYRKRARVLAREVGASGRPANTGGALPASGS